MWRQAQELDAGHTLRQETRGWNDDAGESYLMRTKEQAHDYRYFPDPDLMPVTFTEEEIAELKASLPELPAAMRARLVESGLTAYDASVITADRHLAKWFDEAVKTVKTPKILANWIISELLRELSAASLSIAESPVAPAAFAELVNAVDSGSISGKSGKDVLAEMFTTGKSAGEIIKEKGLAQVSDTGAIEGFVDQAIAANPAQVEQFKAGNPKVLQFLVGQVMKLSRGKANPKLVSDILNEKLK
jgi:aspartyl-tRNA(Asn)/glutamyl-tRNA(Gln) amidotransferase subunit B